MWWYDDITFPARSNSGGSRCHFTAVRMTAAAITVSASINDTNNMDRTKKNVFADDASKAAPHAATVSSMATHLLPKGDA